MEKFALILAIKQNFAYLCTRKQKRRGVAQLVARYVRDVEVGSSSLLTPTIIIKACSPLKTASLSIFLFLKTITQAISFYSYFRTDFYSSSYHTRCVRKMLISR